jgi:hypothetical protein
MEGVSVRKTQHVPPNVSRPAVRADGAQSWPRPRSNVDGLIYVPLGFCAEFSLQYPREALAVAGSAPTPASTRRGPVAFDGQTRRFDLRGIL